MLGYYETMSKAVTIDQRNFVSLLNLLRLVLLLGVIWGGLFR